MGLIYVTFPMSDSWEGFTSLLNGVNSPKANRLQFIYMGMIYVHAQLIMALCATIHVSIQVSIN